jgi:hypothetical protein
MRPLLTCSVSLAALLCLTASAQAQQVALKEQLSYAVTFKGGRVANVTLHTGCPTERYTPTALIATSVGVIEHLKSFLIRLDSFLPNQLTSPRPPFEAHSRITEDEQTRLYKTSFSPALTPRVRSKVLNKDYDWRLPELPTSAHDMLSWVYDLRGLATLKPGTTQRYLVWDGWKLFWLDASALKLAPLILTSGQTQALPIKLTRQRIHHDPSLAFTPQRDPEPLGTLYLATNAPRTPVGFDFDSPIGHVLVRLERTSQTPCSTSTR